MLYAANVRKNNLTTKHLMKKFHIIKKKNNK